MFSVILGPSPDMKRHVKGARNACWAPLKRQKRYTRAKSLVLASILMALVVHLERSILLSPYRTTTWYVPIHMSDCIKFIVVALSVI